MQWAARADEYGPEIAAFIAKGREVAALDRGAPPREWAAFAISGDPMVRVPVTVPAFDWWWRLFH